MTILFLTNNEITRPLSDWLKLEAHENLMEYAKPLNLDIVKGINPDFLISYNYRYIIKEDVLSCIDNKAINLHISLLPWNRGSQPNFWSFIENTPKGVTIHFIDKGIDTGDILVQEELNFDEDIETLESSYKILHEEMQYLFKSKWEDIRSFKIHPVKQRETGSFHSNKDFEYIKSLLGEDIWNIPVSLLKQKYEVANK